MQHEIKCKPVYFDTLLNGTKTAEIRENDRNYQVGDTLLIKDFGTNGYTGRELTRKISHILTDDFMGLQKGWVMLSFEPVVYGYICGGMFRSVPPRNYPLREWVKVSRI
jgi:uncharacterized protein DUF3850